MSKAKPPIAERLTTDIPTLAAQLGVSRNGLYEAAKRGEIRTIAIGRRIVVPNSERDRLLNGKGVKAPA